MFCNLSKPEFTQLFYLYLFSQGQFWWLAKSGKMEKKTLILHPEKTAHICRRHHWVPCEMNERRNSTLMTSYYLDLKCFWLVVPQGKLISLQQIKSTTLDCLQSAFSLKIRLVLDLVQRDCKPRFSRQAASPLACLGFACSNFAKKNKRLLAV